MKRFAAFLLACAAVGLVAGCSGLQPRASADYSLTAAWNGYQRVVVDTRNGEIDVTVDSARSDVGVRGRKSVAGATITAAQENLERVQVTAGPDPQAAGTLRIELEWPGEFDRLGPSASVTVALPAAAVIDADTSNGDVRITEAGAGSRAETSNGSIWVKHARGDVVLDSSNGRIEVVQADGSVKAGTSNSSIELGRVAGAADLRTANGSIRVGEARAALTADTSNGRIEVKAVPPPGTMVRLTSSNGSIRATVPKALAGRVDLETSNGSIQLQGEPLMKIQRTSKSHLVGTMNEGATGGLDADTSNGDITVVFE